MKFVNFVKYRDLDRIAGARPAHFAYADRLRAEGKLAIGGPLMDDQGRRIGLLFVYEALSRDEALALAREDPFTVANALSGCEITEWRLRGANVDLLLDANRAARQGSAEKTQSRLFANYAKYAADKSRLAAVRPAHWEYDRTLENAGKLALAGAFADDEGGLFVYNAVRREDAMSYLKEDPFALEDVFANCEVVEWLVEGLNPDLLTVEQGRKEKTAVATQASTADGPKQDLAVEQKIQKLRELYADAPELGKAALQNGISDIAREFAALTGATGVQSAGRVGARQGKVSELTAILQVAKGGAKRLRGLLELVGGNFRGADVVGTLHDMRFVFLENDTKLLFATAYDGEWDAYIDDFVTKIPTSMDIFFCNLEGWPGIRNPNVKDWLVKHQITADAWYVASPNLTVAETKRLERVGAAVEEFLDKVGG